jgi:HTH-type transcriptional regulator / antitoxin HipB
MQPKDIADIIKEHRRAAKLSRVQLAEMAGVGKTVIYDIEHGKESVRFDTLKKVLKVLNIKIAFTSPLMENINNTGNEKG